MKSDNLLQRFNVSYLGKKKKEKEKRKKRKKEEEKTHKSTNPF